jgi:hypothetical protein
MNRINDTTITALLEELRRVNARSGVLAGASDAMEAGHRMAGMATAAPAATVASAAKT